MAFYHVLIKGYGKWFQNIGFTTSQSVETLTVRIINLLFPFHFSLPFIYISPIHFPFIRPFICKLFFPSLSIAQFYCISLIHWQIFSHSFVVAQLIFKLLSHLFSIHFPIPSVIALPLHLNSNYCPFLKKLIPMCTTL